MKHTQNKRVVCPFYRFEQRQVIYCQGVAPGQGFHLACADPAMALEHKKRCCRDDYRACALARMLEAHYA